MNTTENFYLNFWMKDEIGTDGESHLKERFTQRYMYIQANLISRELKACPMGGQNEPASIPTPWTRS